MKSFVKLIKFPIRALFRVKKKLNAFHTLLKIKIQPIRHYFLKLKVRGKFKKNIKIKIVFLITHFSIWKYDDIYRMFLFNERFDVSILITPVVNQGHKNMVENMHHIESNLKKRNLNFVNLYNKQTNQYLNVKREIKPDIVFFTNPHQGLVYEKYYFPLLSRYLSVYVPYSFRCVNRDKDHYDKTFMNLVWKVFYESHFHLKKASLVARNKAQNGVLSGYPPLEKLNYGFRTNRATHWKSNNEKYKRIIWAPHHTIENQNPLSFSTFLKFSDIFIEIARFFSDDVQFVFKPHPLLKYKLYQDDFWGYKKTTEYYQLWSSMINTSVHEDDYIDLFNESDAIIHDSNSFLAEYFYTGKPCLYLVQNDKLYDQFNELGQEILKHYYQAENREDICNFINTSVILENDELQESRNEFFNKRLKIDNDVSPSKYIYNYLLNKISE